MTATLLRERCVCEYAVVQHSTITLTAPYLPTGVGRTSKEAIMTTMLLVEERLVKEVMPERQTRPGPSADTSDHLSSRLSGWCAL